MTGYPTLFEPMRLGQRIARNRIVRAATTANLSFENVVTPAMIAHYARIAEGGVGTIVTDALRVNRHTLHGTYGIAVYDEKVIPGLTALSDALHERGALLIGQINHSGRQHTATTVPAHLVGPSAIACPRSGGVPHPLSEHEVREMVEAFVVSAVNVARSGADGVELNGAQGHLLQQFLSPFSNRRTDAYGGSAEGRARFAVEILTEIRDRTPGDFAVGYRLGVDEFTEGGLTTEITAEFAQMLEAAGLIDYVSFSQGNFNSIDAHLPDRHFAPTPFAAVQREVGDRLDRVTRIACTRIRTPEEAEDILAQGWADGVAMSRPLTVDPDWPVKAAAGAAETIRPCIQCNHCWSGQHEGINTLHCVLNPIVGRELKLGPLVASRESRRLVVVGGGPAGLEAARVAAMRGHHVTLLEAEAELGGKVASDGGLGGHLDFARIVPWLEAEVQRLGVEVLLNTVGTAASVAGLAPDAVVVATGAVPEIPDIRTDGSVALYRVAADLPADLTGQRIVSVDEDGHYWAAQLSEEIGRRGGVPIVMTRFFEAFRELPIVSRIAALRRLDESDAVVHAMHEVVSIEGGTVHARHYDSHRPLEVEGVNGIIWAGPQQPQGFIADEIRRAVPGVEVTVVGDAFAPRRIINAMREAFDVSWKL